MSWNYRVVKTDEGFSIYEVYYDEVGKPKGITERPTLDFFCDTPEAILEELELVRRAIEESALNINEIGTENA